MRVLFVDCIKNEIGGGHMVLARLANHFYRDEKYGVEPFVLMNAAGDFRRRFLEDGITFIPFSWGGRAMSMSRGKGWGAMLSAAFSPSVIRAWGALFRAIRDNRIDVVHANSMMAFLLSCLPARLCGAALVCHMHDSLPAPGDGGAFSDAARKFLLFFMKKFAGRVVAVSGFVRQTIVADGEGLREKTVVLHNGLETGGIKPAPRACHAGPPKLLALGRLHPDKGFDMAIKAVSALKRDFGVEAGLKILGDGPMRGALETLAGSEGVSGQVEFAGFRDNVHEYMAEADIVLVPSLWEDPLPLVVMEAMANARIVIASKTGGIPEMITDGREGILVPKARPDALTEKILWVMAHPEEAAEMAARARARAASEFTLRRMAGDLAGVYKSL
ncbi:MAG: glycosyltransferase family 4 protein [Nitrospiraceae bacterium]|nr:glycosyltransferase family 4 protein [Nitrospiraceae bacterium]